MCVWSRGPPFPLRFFYYINCTARLPHCTSKKGLDVSKKRKRGSRRLLPFGIRKSSKRPRYREKTRRFFRSVLDWIGLALIKETNLYNGIETLNDLPQKEILKYHFFYYFITYNGGVISDSRYVCFNLYSIIIIYYIFRLIFKLIPFVQIEC